MRSQPGRASLLLLVLVALAGCSYAPSASSGQTVTPAGVPAETATPLPSYPPGLTSQAITDPDALTAAHVAVLDNRSFTATRSRTEHYGNGSLRYSVVETTQYAPNHHHYYLVSTFDGSYEWSIVDVLEFEIWSDGDDTVRRVNTTPYITIVRGEVPGFPDFTYAGWFFGVTSTVDSPQVDGTPREASRLYRIEDRTIEEPLAFVRVTGVTRDEIESVRNASVSAEIRQNGLIVRLTVRYTIETAEATIDVVETIRISDIGSTEVPRPDWVNETLELTGG